jgi:heme o synthase
MVMLVTSFVGMYLATTQTLHWFIVLFAILGMGLSGAAAAVINHLVDREIDAKMVRTQRRPLVNGRITTRQALLFSLILSMIGLSLLYFFINKLTALLTFATFLGYAGVYTLFLKRTTPQNIVIGGLSGAMPPLLGWTAVSGEITSYPLLLVLIIFTWTPPHFWALAIYRLQDYKNAKIPMLPVTHGIKFTKLCIVLYTLLLIAASLLPFVVKMSGYFYLVSAIIFGLVFLRQTLILYKSEQEETALKTFNVSIIYLLLLFIALLIDHAEIIHEVSL